jgi:hypothetical protein
LNNFFNIRITGCTVSYLDVGEHKKNMTRDKNDEDNFCKLLEEQLRRLLHLYKSKLKQFKVVFSLLIAFSSFFFFIILLPYISTYIEMESISDQKSETLDKIKQLNNKINQVSSGVSLVRDSNDIFKVLRNQIVHGPEDLRIFAVNLWVPNSSQTGQEDTAHKGFQNCSMMAAGTYKWLDCNLRIKVLSQLNGYKELVNQNITVPVLTVGEELLEDKERIALKEELGYKQQSLVEKLENQKKEMKKYPQIFTLTMSGNSEVNVILNETFLDSWNEYEQITGTHSNKLRDLLFKIQYNLNKEGDIVSGLQDEKKRLQETANDLQNQIEQIDIRFNQPVSPFQGIFLIEMIPLYPMSLALGFLVSISILRDIYQLRRVLYQLYKKRDPESNILVNEDIVINPPLWIDLLNPTQNHIARSFVLIIPFLFFSITLIMLLYVWFFIHDTFNVFSDMIYFNKITYGILYILSTAIFAYSFLVLRKEYSLISPFKNENNETESSSHF